MKIQNISSGILPVAVSFMTAAGESISVNLNQGDFVYTDSNVETKSIVILMKKRHIKTIDENKPDNVVYFQVYPNGTQLSESSTQPTPKAEEVDTTLDKYRNEFKIPSRPLAPKAPNVVINPDLDVLSDKALFPEKVEQANEILKETILPAEHITPQITHQVPEEAPAIVKNKGGRPKGSKDTVKRGEPKIKKPAGRPINTEVMQGKAKDEVIAKCKSRGYDVRITKEDGNSYIVTRDFRPDRVNVIIENGIVTKADIG